MVKTRIKASQISNLTDARYFAAWGVDWLGFNLNQEVGEVLPANQILAIKEWIEGPKLIGEFGNMDDKDQLLAAIEILELDGLQVGMLTELNILIELGDTLLLQEWIIGKEEDLIGLSSKFEERTDCVEFFILNFNANCSEWENIGANGKAIIQELCTKYKIILKLDLDPDKIARIQIEANPFGISLTGGAEEKVGFKSFDELDEIFEFLEEED